MSTLRILVVDDNRSSATALSKLLSRGGDDVTAMFDGASAIERIQTDPPDIVLTDLKMEPVDGMAVLSVARSMSPPVEVIVFTAFGAVDVAVRAMHLGARDFLTKPVTVDQVAARLDALRGERAGHQLKVGPDAQDATFVAEAQASRELLSTLERAAGVPSSLWLGGELGSGRAYAARTLHHKGATDGPFLVANPRSRIDWPSSGTVLLPNVDALDADQQLALSNELGRCPESVRIIATAGDDGRQQVASGQLRPELYYKLAVVVVTVPPLRQRKEDIRPLFDVAVDYYSKRYRRPRPEVPDRIYRNLETHYWPGNIRELRNVAERAVVLGSDGLEFGVIRTSNSNSGLPKLEPGFSLARHLEDVERSILEEALRQTGGDRNAAGRLLGVERNTLRYKLNKYDLLDRTSH